MAKAPFHLTFERTVVNRATGSGGDTALFVAPFDGVIHSASYIAHSDITGADSNTRKVAVVNKGDDGTGTTEAASLQFDSGTDADDFDENELTLSGTAANLAVSAGDVIAWSSTAVGSGLADPGGLARVVFARS